MISHAQLPGGSTDNGLTPLPLDRRPGILMPTPENLQRVADAAANKRAREVEARNTAPQDLARNWGVPRDLVFYIQRLENRVAELEREVESLRTDRTSALPPHLRNLEKRG